MSENPTTVPADIVAEPDPVWAKAQSPMSEPQQVGQRAFCDEKSHREREPQTSIPRTADRAMRAIKNHCLRCVDGSHHEVRKCLACASNSEVCELHKFLTAGKAGRYWTGALRAIRSECLLCMGGSCKAVGLCPSRTCALWPYRYGVRPATAARRGLQVDIQEPRR